MDISEFLTGNVSDEDVKTEDVKIKFDILELPIALQSGSKSQVSLEISINE